MKIVWNVDCGSDAHAIIMSLFRSPPRDSVYHANDGKMMESDAENHHRLAVFQPGVSRASPTAY
jgi:hypothetical protein